MIRSLFKLYRRLKTPPQAAFFSPEWYQAQYPDVAAAGINPWVHFHLHGRQESRFPCAEHIEIFFDDYHFRGLISEFNETRNELPAVDKRWLGWLIARRYAAASDWRAVCLTLESHDFSSDLKANSSFAHLPALMYCDALCRLGDVDAAQRHLEWLRTHSRGVCDIKLMEANALHADGAILSWLNAVNAIYEAAGSLPLSLDGERLSLDRLRVHHGHGANGPLVTILMAGWNAERTIETALFSLLNQTHRNLEVIVVDDASTDHTAATVELIADRDPRVRLLRQSANQGPYAARNRAIEEARGDFITVHDSDDWSHPEKIAMQLRALLEHPQLKASQSAWVRVSDDLYFGGWDTPPSWQGWVHRNTSSLMIRRSVFESLGYWDEVRCSADLEYVERIQAAWGPGAIKVVFPDLPLAFGRVGSQTITRLPETHLLTALKGLRHDYQQAYSAWHARAGGPADLYMPKTPVERPFPIADNMLISRENPTG